jgi:hypothetical protein
MQDDIGRDLEFVAAVIAGSVHKKQDQFLVIFFFAKVSRKIWKYSVSGAGRIRKMQVPSFGQTAPYK